MNRDELAPTDSPSSTRPFIHVRSDGEKNYSFEKQRKIREMVV